MATQEKRLKIAVIGSGAAGLTAAYYLSKSHDVVLYEAADRLGGHANTVTVDDPTLGSVGVDTGFIVHNDRNYPNFLELINELGVATQPSEMSFAVDDIDRAIIYRATSPKTLFAKKSNLVKADMWRMLRDIFRFHRAGKKFLQDGSDQTNTTAQFIKKHRYSNAFVELYLIPLGSSVWSADPQTFLDFPAYSLLSFLDNHGLLSIGNRPNWRTVTGGSQTYVQALAKRFEEQDGRIMLNSKVTSVTRSDDQLPCRITTGQGTERYDKVVVACHSDQALDILEDSTDQEADFLSAIRYQKNTATLHTDTTILPQPETTWAAWNYRATKDASDAHITYDLTNLQRLDTETRYLVTLNDSAMIDEQKILAQFDYAHPVFNQAAISAQRNSAQLLGEGVTTTNTFFCGAYCGYGFHEDAVVAARRVVDAIEKVS